MPKSLTIGLATFNRGRLLLQTVGQILDEPDLRGFPILVVDQAPSHDMDVEMQLDRMHQQNKIMRICVSEPSLTRARNLIVANATTEVVLFLDDDIVLPRGSAVRHLAHYADPLVGAVAGEVWHCHDPSRPPSLSNPQDGASAHFGTRLRSGKCKELVGANFSIRRGAVIQVGGFDESLVGPASFEDSDIALRLCTQGVVVKFDPSAWIIHLRAPSGGCRIPKNRSFPEWENSANFLIFWLRYGGSEERARAALWQSLRAGPLRRENVLKIWRQPWAWISWIRALFYASRNRTPADAFEENRNLLLFGKHPQ